MGEQDKYKNMRIMCINTRICIYIYTHSYIIYIYICKYMYICRYVWTCNANHICTYIVDM